MLKSSIESTTINTLRPRQSEHHFVDDIFTFIFLMKIVFWFKFNWSLFLRIQLTISQQSRFQLIFSHRTDNKPLSESVTV